MDHAREFVRDSRLYRGHAKKSKALTPYPAHREKEKSSSPVSRVPAKRETTRNLDNKKHVLRRGGQFSWPTGYTPSRSLYPLSFFVDLPCFVKHRRPG